jgi:predicted PurR-regulated permease PerM
MAMGHLDGQVPEETPTKSSPVPWPVILRRLTIWTILFTFLYLARDFFFTGFMTFLFSYLALALVNLAMKRLSPDRERPALRRLLTLAVFVLVPLAVVGVGILVGPRLLRQVQHLAGWLSQANPETEVARLLESYVGPAEFKRKYPDPQDPGYQKDLAEFRESKVAHVKEYNDFPNLEAWVEGGFSKQYADTERGRIRTRLIAEGVSSKDFEEWFLKEKLPELQEQAKKQVPAKGRPNATIDPLVRAAATVPDAQILDHVRRDANTIAALREEWLQDTVNKNLAAAKGTRGYLLEFRPYYEKRVKESPTVIPYTFDQYIELQKIRPQGPEAFGAAVEKITPSTADSETQLKKDFEASKTHELFTEWWGSSSVAKFIRHHVESTESSASSNRLEKILYSLLNLPVDLSTALLLSFFICIDFPRMNQALGSLRDTWLRDVYDDIAPVLSHLGQLIGLSMHAQGLVALCNALMIFIALNILGIEHSVLLSVATFVLCLVPTLGTMIAWVLIAAVALVQPGGGVVLALKASGAVLVVILLETFVFSPRILGRMMELHPVLMLSILPIAQYFFGVWGLILATPVAVYVIHVLILRRGLPGRKTD